MKKPNFFIVGAPKCGTTAMAHYLSEHPDIFMSSPKEPHYFNFDFEDRHTKKIEMYEGIFSDAGDAKIIAESIGSLSVLRLCDREYNQLSA
jgi:hypothetical protein